VRSTVDAVLDAAQATMRRKRYCVLATSGPRGVHARVLQPYPPRPDFSVLFGTSRASRKVAELSRDPRATLIYEDDARGACVTLIGTAALLPKSEPKRFMPSWVAFWPDGAADPDFTNLRFVPERIEVWDGWRGITPEPFGLVSARVRRAGEGWTWDEAPPDEPRGPAA
jgi:general stress protein 26